MPLYEFVCQNCDCRYEDLAPQHDETGKYPDIACPNCNSKKKKKLMSEVAFTFGNPIGTSKWTSDSHGHDYRFKWNAPRVKQQRDFAEKNSHMGVDPYPHIDDISSGKHFGKVK